MNDIITQLQALQTADDAALATIVAALQALPPATPAADHVISVSTLTAGGVTTTFVLSAPVNLNVTA